MSLGVAQALHRRTHVEQVVTGHAGLRKSEGVSWSLFGAVIQSSVSQPRFRTLHKSGSALARNRRS
jgi:hypothetical protein